ncbi:Semaphorin-5A [Trichoplax sp. H2]|nr:Semaphorin-5A [Trichoplax sp. H2]|eukprot:RDD45621.1 Semaphorin-5A [Trichoplax sp. H2]
MAYDSGRRKLIVGAKNAFVSLDTSDISLSPRVYPVPVNQAIKSTCTSARPTKVQQCENFVRVLLVHDDTLLVCGTNAYQPICQNRSLSNLDNMLTNPQNYYCPSDPTVDNGAIVDGNKIAFSYNHNGNPTIQMSELENVNSYVRSEVNNRWLNDPHYVAEISLPGEIFFFFREHATEAETVEKMIFSRVSRICKNDQGAPNAGLRHMMTSFQKARLDCSLPGQYPYYFNYMKHVQHISGTYNPNGIHTKRDLFYGVFTTATNGVVTSSAICVYDVKALNTSFFSDFKAQRFNDTNSGPKLDVDSAWIRQKNPLVDRYRLCKQSPTTAADEAKVAFKYQLMYNPVQPLTGRPLYVRTGQFSRIAIDQVTAKSGEVYDVMFVSLDTGHVDKVVMLLDSATRKFTKAHKIETIDVLPSYAKGNNRKILSMELHKANSKSYLYLGTETLVAQVPLSQCQRYKSCEDCLGIKDPYCGWNTQSNLCTTMPSSNMQHWLQRLDDRTVDSCPCVSSCSLTATSVSYTSAVLSVSLSGTNCNSGAALLRDNIIYKNYTNRITSTNIQVDNLSPGKSFTFEMRPFQAKTCGNLCNTKVTTKAGTPILNELSIQNNRINIKWRAVADLPTNKAIYYQIYRKGDNCTKFIHTTTTTAEKSLTYEDGNIRTNQQYDYSVRACYSNKTEDCVASQWKSISTSGIIIPTVSSIFSSVGVTSNPQGQGNGVNVWLYAFISTAGLLVITVIVAIYLLCRQSNKRKTFYTGEDSKNVTELDTITAPNTPAASITSTPMKNNNASIQQFVNLTKNEELHRSNNNLSMSTSNTLNSVNGIPPNYDKCMDNPNLAYESMKPEDQVDYSTNSLKRDLPKAYHNGPYNSLPAEFRKNGLDGKQQSTNGYDSDIVVPKHGMHTNTLPHNITNQSGRGQSSARKQLFHSLPRDASLNSQDYKIRRPKKLDLLPLHDEDELSTPDDETRYNSLGRQSSRRGNGSVYDSSPNDPLPPRSPRKKQYDSMQSASEDEIRYNSMNRRTPRKQKILPGSKSHTNSPVDPLASSQNKFGSLNREMNRSRSYDPEYSMASIYGTTPRQLSVQHNRNYDYNPSLSQIPSDDNYEHGYQSDGRTPRSRRGSNDYPSSNSRRGSLNRDPSVSGTIPRSKYVRELSAGNHRGPGNLEISSSSSHRSSNRSDAMIGNKPTFI